MHIISVSVQGDGDSVYEIGFDDAGQVTCSCPAFRFAAGSSVCKHIVYVYNSIKLPPLDGVHRDLRVVQ